MVVATVLAAALGVWQAYLTNRVGQDVMRDLRGRLFAHLQRLSLRFFTGTRTGEIQSRLQNDVGGLQSVITETAGSILGNIVVIGSTLVAMTVLSWQLTLLSLALLPVFVWLTDRVGRVRRTLTGQTQGALSEMSAITWRSRCRCPGCCWPRSSVGRTATPGATPWPTRSSRGCRCASSSSGVPSSRSCPASSR